MTVLFHHCIATSYRLRHFPIFRSAYIVLCDMTESLLHDYAYVPPLPPPLRSAHSPITLSFEDPPQ